MAWYVVELSSPSATTIGDVTASVQQFANAAAYTKAVGASPQQVDPRQPAAGYATQAQAQAEANRFNALPAAQRSAGGKPLAPSVVPKLPTITNPLDFLRSIAAFFDRLTEANTWLRVGEFLLGGALLALGISKLFADTKAGKAAGKAIKTGVKVAAL